MSAAAEVQREEAHFRRIDMRGWRRSDGLYEVQGRVTDRKPHEFKAPNGPRVVAAGEAIHDMEVTLTFDSDMLVHEVRATTFAAPYASCQGGPPTLQSLKGLRIAGGWGPEVRKRLGGAQSCTHLMEILSPMATVAFQTLSLFRLARPDRLNAVGKPVKIDSCLAYSSKGSLVRDKWPAFYTGEAEEGGGKGNDAGNGKGNDQGNGANPGA